MPNIRFLKLLFCALFACILEAEAFEAAEILTLTDRNGLSQNTVRCMMVDRRNFLWLGTVNGLNRFNGQDFLVIHPRQRQASGRADSRIRELVEDLHGFIWIRTFSNTVFCYDTKREGMTEYAREGENMTFSHIHPLTNGDVWLWGDEGCMRVRYIHGKHETWCPETGTNKEILFLREDAGGRIWMSTPQALYLVEGDRVSLLRQGRYWDALSVGEEIYLAGDQELVGLRAGDGKLSFRLTLSHPVKHAQLCALHKDILLLTSDGDTHFFDCHTRKTLPTARFFDGKEMKQAHFQIDNRGEVWVYNRTGILWRHQTDNTFEPLHLIPSDILKLNEFEQFQVHHDSRDIIWISTFGNGLFAIRPDGSLTHFTKGSRFPTNYLYGITEDASSEIWVGTELAGLIKISLPDYAIQPFYPAPEDGIERNNAVRLIFKDSEGHYWLGTRDGHLYVCDDRMKRLHTHHIEGGLPFALTEDTLGYKWLGTKGAGLFILSPGGERILTHHNLPTPDGQASTRDNIYSLLRDRKNRIWVATLGKGLFLAERNGEKLNFRSFAFPDMHQNRMRALIQDSREGRIWISTDDGLLSFQPETLIQTQQRGENITQACTRQLNDREVKVVYEDHRGRIWAGVTGGGLYLLEGEGKHYGRANGLTNETIQAIIEDNEGYLWVSTESGISRLNESTERFENIVYSNQSSPLVFNELACWKEQNGTLLFGSYEGIYRFNPAQVHFDTYAPDVRLTRLFLHGDPVSPEEEDSPLQTSLDNTKELVLKHDQNSFNLEYTLLNYHAPEMNQYAYLLDGYETNWNRSVGNPLAAYRNVPPGRYVFKVRGTNSSGVWSQHTTELPIRILPPWWKSTGAILLYFTAGILLAIVALRITLKMNRLRMKVAAEKQLTEYKLRFFTNISHEFRTPLTIIRGTIETLADSKEIAPLIGSQLRLLSKSSTRLMRLIDQLLEFRRLQNGKTTLNLEHVQAKTFFKDIYQTFSEIANRKHIDYSFKADFPEQPLLLDKDKLDKIVYNLLSNAFKHTPDGGKIEMELEMKDDEDKFIANVSDSGPGIPPEKRKTLFVRFAQARYHEGGIGIGLHLVAELTKIHQGSAEYHDSKWNGACFTITLPLSDKNYNATNVVGTDATDGQKREEVVLLTDNIEKLRQEPIYGSYRLLVIEDDDDVRELITKQLSNRFTVFEASNGAEGLQKVAKDAPDLIVCDLMMPQMDGLTFTKKLKSDFNTSHIPVILLTAYSSEEYRLKGIQAGADSYITKPFSMNYLLIRVVKLIEQREKLKRKFASEPGMKQPPTIAMTDPDKVFLDKIHALIGKNLGDGDFKLETYVTDFKIGRTTFFNKIKNLTGYSPNEYVRVIRMKKAAELLLTTEYNISEVSYQVGMNDPLYFSKCFKSTFGKSPSQYRKDKGGQT